LLRMFQKNGEKFGMKIIITEMYEHDVMCLEKDKKE
jgi:hypothetical protein